MTNIAITGVAGFIGSHLARRLLAENHTVIGIDNFDPFYSRKIKQNNIIGLYHNPNFQFFDLDTRTENFSLAMLNSDVDVIVHLSARAGVRPSLMFPKSYVHHDIEATVNILETVRKEGINKLIFGSSSSVYGNDPRLPYSEELNIDKPISPYAAAKLSCEHFNYVYHHQYGIDISNLRFFTVYGPGQRPEMGIHKFTRLIYHDEPVYMYGDGSSSRDYTYIDDIVDGIILSIDNLNGYHTYNLGNFKEIELKYLIELIGNELGKKPNIISKPMQPGDVDHTLADISKAQSELGYNPTTNIEDGIKLFVKWYLDQNEQN